MIDGGAIVTLKNRICEKCNLFYNKVTWTEWAGVAVMFMIVSGRCLTWTEWAGVGVTFLTASGRCFTWTEWAGVAVTFLTVSGRCPVQISTRVPTIVSEVFVVFSVAPNHAGAVPRLGHDQFLSHPYFRTVEVSKISGMLIYRFWFNRPKGDSRPFKRCLVKIPCSLFSRIKNKPSPFTLVCRAKTSENIKTHSPCSFQSSKWR
jgi:hypothetical protein